MSESIPLKQSSAVGCLKEKDLSPAKVLYALLMGFNLLSYLFMLASKAEIDSIPTLIWITRLVSVPFAICLGKLWKDRGFQILCLYFLWFFLRCIIPDTQNMFMGEIAQSSLTAFWVFASCYGLGRIMRGKLLKGFLLICSCLWIAGIAVYGAMGVYAAWIGGWVRIAGLGYFGTVTSWRLDMIYLSTIAGNILSSTLIVDIILFMESKNRLGRTLLAIAAIPMVIAMALTDARTAYIGLSVGIGVIVFIKMIRYERKRLNNREKHALVISVAGMILAFFLTLLLVMQITPLFNYIRTQGLIPPAVAEEENHLIVYEHRGFGGDDSLSGRTELWSDIFKVFLNDPVLLLTGKGKIQPLSGISDSMIHCHSTYIQVFTESGIPGILLFLSFLFYIGKKGIKLLNRQDAPDWIKTVLGLVVSLLVVDFVECFLCLRSSQCSMIALFFISAGIISAQDQRTELKTIDSL